MSPSRRQGVENGHGAAAGEPQVERGYKCNEPGCGRSFMRPEHLSRHQLNHRPAKVFICSRCPKRFVRLDLYQRHKARHDKGMHFRNTGGVVQGDAQPGVTIVEEKLSPTTMVKPGQVEERRHQQHEHYQRPVQLQPQLQPQQSQPQQLSQTPQQVSPPSRDYFTPANTNNLPRDLSSNAPHFQNRTPSFSETQTSYQTQGRFAEALQLEDSARALTQLSIPPMRDGQYTSPLQQRQPVVLAPPNPSAIIPGFGFTYGSPPVAPDTLFFDASANIWDLPDNLDWFFETPDQNPNALAGMTNTETAMAFGAPSSSFLSPPATLPSFQDQMALPYSMPTTENTWFTVQGKLLQALSSIQQDLHPHFFAPANLATCFNLFFENYNPHFPLIHRPSLILTEAEPLLLAVIITLGSTLSTDETIYEVGQKIHSNLRWIIFQTGAFEPPCPLWCLQSLLLVEAQAKMASSRKNYEMAHVFHGAIITMMKRGRALSSFGGYNAHCKPAATEQHTSLEVAWLQWAHAESSRRAAFFAFIMDSQHASVFGHTPVLSVSDIRLPLPCTEQLFDCQTAAQWHEMSQRLPQPPGFLATLKAILGGVAQPASGGISDFSRLILLHGFLSLITNIHAREAATLGIGGNGSKTSASETSTAVVVSNTASNPTTQSSESSSRRGSVTSTHPDSWSAILTRALTSWSFTLLSLNPSLPLEAARPLYRLSHITLSSPSLVDFHILARDPAFLDNPLSQLEWRKTERRLREWRRTDGAREAVRHAVLLVKETCLSGGGRRYLAREDCVAVRPWCLYLAVLLLWCFGWLVEDGDASTQPLHLETDITLGAEEYIARMLSALEKEGYSSGAAAGSRPRVREGKSEVARWARMSQGLIRGVRGAFEGCRWELLQEAYKSLCRLAVRREFGVPSAVGGVTGQGVMAGSG